LIERNAALASFERYIGIDYSGAKTPVSSLKGLRVYLANGSAVPVEEPPPAGRRKYWTRRGIAEWLVNRLAEKVPTLVGIDHGFSLPLSYFEAHGLGHSWSALLDDFKLCWPSDVDDVRVRDISNGRKGIPPYKRGDWKLLRLTEARTRAAKSVLNFDQKQGCVAYSTHAGIPWLRFIREVRDLHVHFWPFDGWSIRAGLSAVAEVYPALWSHDYSRIDRTSDQHDAFSVATWLSSADRNGSLGNFLNPMLAPHERKVAEVEGWILGVT
jgi:hypothetical protein